MYRATAMARVIMAKYTPLTRTETTLNNSPRRTHTPMASKKPQASSRACTPGLTDAIPAVIRGTPWARNRAIA